VEVYIGWFDLDQTARSESSQSNRRQNHEDRTVRLLGHFTLRRSSALDLLLRPQRKWPAAHVGSGVGGLPRVQALLRLSLHDLRDLGNDPVRSEPRDDLGPGHRRALRRLSGKKALKDKYQPGDVVGGY
jgi:hypothetical protein